MTHCLHQRDKIDNDCNRTSATVRFQMMPSPMITRSKDANSEVAFTRPPRNQRQKCYNKEEIDFIEDLKKRNEALHCEQRRLQGKLKIASITIQKLKEQVQTWKRRCTANMNHLGNTSSTNYYCTRSRNATAKQNGCKIRANSICATNSTNGSNNNATGYLEDNHHQQRQNPDEVRCSSVNCYKERAPGKEAEMINFLREQAGKNACFDNCSRDSGSSRGIIINDDPPQISALLHKLKTAKSDMNTLQAQYIALESASEVQLELHQQTLEQLEECNLYILELKDSICRLNESHDKLKNMSISMDEHKEIMQELLQENKYLEDKLSTLCELPFLSLGEQNIRALANYSPHAIEIRQHQEQIEQNHELENEIDQCKQQIELLSKTNFDLHEHTLLLEKENNELKSSLALSHQCAVLAKGKNVNTTSHQQGHNTDSLDENL